MNEATMTNFNDAQTEEIDELTSAEVEAKRQEEHDVLVEEYLALIAQAIKKDLLVEADAEHIYLTTNDSFKRHDYFPFSKRELAEMWADDPAEYARFKKEYDEYCRTNNL